MRWIRWPQEACPFKNSQTSNGMPLALELETRSWGLWIGSETNNLAQKLKEGTAEAHKAAENVHFVKEFIKCRVDQQPLGGLGFDKSTARCRGGWATTLNPAWRRALCEPPPFGYYPPLGSNLLVTVTLQSVKGK